MFSRVHLRYRDLGWGNQFGGTGGNYGSIDLDPDEYIYKVTGEEGNYILRMRYYTNKGRVFGPYGNGGGSQFEASSNGGRLLWISSVHGSYINALKFFFLCNPET